METVRIWATSLLFFGWFVVTTGIAWMVFLCLVPLALLFDPDRRRILNWTMATWGYQFAGLLPMWRVTWEGREHVGGDRPLMIVANHQSFADIPVLFGLRHNFKFVSKHSIFQVPIIGWAMRLNDYIELVRGDPASITKMMDACRAHLRKGNSILMFPEGTRTPDGRLRPFRLGAFTLARELDVEVLPVVLDGTLRIIPKQGLLIRSPWRLHVPVRILEPIHPRDFASARALAEHTRTRMAEALADLRGVSPAEVMSDARTRTPRAAGVRTDHPAGSPT